MKRFLSLSTIIFFALGITWAQTEFDLIKFTQPDINGTARYNSMAGAFGALGGDASAIKDNPAGLGIYRSSEISGGFNLNVLKTESSWHNAGQTVESLYRPLYNNFNFVMAFPTSSYSSSNLKSSNFAFSANRLKNFDRNIRVKGGTGVNSSLTDYLSYFSSGIPEDDLYNATSYDPYENWNVPWMSVMAANTGLIYYDAGANNWVPLLDAGETVSPAYTSKENGYLNEYSFSWAGNFNNQLFLGVSINIYDLYYRSYTEYWEDFANGGGLSLLNNFSTDASGVGVKLGGIYTPINNIRLGLSLQTPVFFTVSDRFYADMNSAYEGTSGPVRYAEKTPYGDNEFKIQGPLSYNLSGAYILGKKALISGELVLSHNNFSKFMDMNRSPFDYADENDGIRSAFKLQKMIKLGGEYKLTDNFAIRAGYAIANSTTQPNMHKLFIPNTTRTDVSYFTPNSINHFLAAGVGYRDKYWFIDFAVMNKSYSEKFYAYNSNNLNPAFANRPGEIKTNDFNIITTFGIRF